MSKHITIWSSIGLLIILGLAFLGYQTYRANDSHTSFEKYYAFRGCGELIEKADTYATCKVASGNTIKIVLINGKWYLDGDGPGVW